MSKFFCFLLLFRLLFVWGSLCPEEYQLSLSGEHCIAPIYHTTSFEEAKVFCSEMHGNLTSVQTQQEVKFFAELGKKFFGCENLTEALIHYDLENDPTFSITSSIEQETTQDSSCAYIDFCNITLKEGDCSKPRYFFCSLPLLISDGLTKSTPGTCPYSPTKSLEPTNVLRCTMGDNGCENWNVLSIIALQNSDYAKDTLGPINNFLKQITTYCNSNTEIFFMTPGQARRNESCEMEHKSNLNSVLNNIPVTDTEVLSSNGSEILFSILDRVLSPDYCALSLDNNTGGIMYFFTDLTCEDWCTSEMSDAQNKFIDGMTKIGYNLRFIYVGNNNGDEECIQKIFERCWEYTLAVCTMSADPLTTLAVSPVMQICMEPEPEPQSLSEGWIIGISVAVVVIVFMCIAGRCYFRYKTLSHGWKTFWLKQTQGLKEGIGGQMGHSTILNDYQNHFDTPYEPDDWEIEPENLTVGENDILGSGAFATVYLGYLKGDIPLVQRSGNNIHLGIRKESDGSYKVAVKRLPPHATSEGRLDFRSEINFMKELGHHPHILNLLGVVFSSHSPQIVIENCENGDLLSYVRAKKEEFIAEDINGKHSLAKEKAKQLISIAWQISDGMNYLFSRNFIHRDIAARNILLTKQMVAKIGDFGLCRLVDSSLYTAKGGRLPIKWMAPESLKYYEYSPKSDVWSFSVLLFELFSLGEAPYQTIQPQDMPKYLEDGNRLPQPDTCPDKIYDLMNECWKWKAEDRYDVDQIRADLTTLLNLTSENYGYISVMEQEFDQDVCPI